MTHFRTFPIMASAFLGLTLALSGCSPQPDLSGPIEPLDDNVPWPTLMDSAAVSAAIAAPERSAEETTDALAARAAAANRRADALRNNTAFSD